MPNETSCATAEPTVGVEQRVAAVTPAGSGSDTGKVSTAAVAGTVVAVTVGEGAAGCRDGDCDTEGESDGRRAGALMTIHGDMEGRCGGIHVLSLR